MNTEIEIYQSELVTINDRIDALDRARHEASSAHLHQTTVMVPVYGLHAGDQEGATLKQVEAAMVAAIREKEQLMQYAFDAGLVPS